LNILYTCPLCVGEKIKPYIEDESRQYYICQNCQLVFVDPLNRLNAEQEKAEYDKHNNSPNDLAYRNFLSRLQNPVLTMLAVGDRGLDFGCGPGPTLSVMFEECGFDVDLYDKYYFDDKSKLENYYNFIVATEVAEHLYQPGEVIKKLWYQLLPGGVLGLMTKLVIDKEAFVAWHYKNDPTHVCFFSKTSFLWLAMELSADINFIGSDVILLQRPINNKK
jgi:2-polyprenyl-3-methyl-5-hydroxy-6-metoxy-1,4-benzoquinol methylase